MRRRIAAWALQIDGHCQSKLGSVRICTAHVGVMTVLDMISHLQEVQVYVSVNGVQKWDGRMSVILIE